MIQAPSRVQLKIAALAISIGMLFACSASAQITFFGSSAPVAQHAIDHWMFTYSAIRPDITFSHTYNALGSVLVANLNSSSVDFGCAGSPLTAAQQASSVPPNDFIQAPVVAAPVIFQYNIPGFIDQPTRNLVLDRVTTARIFALQITNWRDPAIVSLQTPDVAAALPNATIVVVLRSDAAYITQEVTSFFLSVMPSWPWGVANFYPASMFARPNVVGIIQNSGVNAAVTATPNSIGCIPFSDMGILSQKYAWMINKNGDVLSTPDLGPALDAAVFDSALTTRSLIDSAAPGAWPVGMMVYGTMRKNGIKNGDCARQRELYLFWKWALTATSAQNRLKGAGMSPLGSRVTAMSLNKLQAVGCPSSMFTTSSKSIAYANKYLDEIAVPQHTSSVVAWTFGGGLAYLGISVVVAVTYMVMTYHETTLPALIFALIMMCGALLNIVGFAFFYLVPSTDSVCQNRLWLSCLGHTMMLGSIFGRGFQIRSVHRMMETQQLRATVKHLCITLASNTVLIMIQVLYLAVWTGVDPFISSHDDHDLLLDTFSFVCRSSGSLWGWWAGELVFLFSLLGFGLFVVYNSWDIKHMVQEHKWIAIAIYNTVVVIAILLALFTSSNPNDDSVFFVAGCASMFLTATTLLSMFAPKLIEKVKPHLLKSSHKESGAVGSGAAGALVGGSANAFQGTQLKSTKNSPVHTQNKQRISFTSSTTNTASKNNEGCHRGSLDQGVVEASFSEKNSTFTSTTSMNKSSSPPASPVSKRRGLLTGGPVSHMQPTSGPSIHLYGAAIGQQQTQANPNPHRGSLSLTVPSAVTRAFTASTVQNLSEGSQSNGSINTSTNVVESSSVENGIIEQNSVQPLHTTASASASIAGAGAGNDVDEPVVSAVNQQESEHGQVQVDVANIRIDIPDCGEARNSFP